MRWRIALSVVLVCLCGSASARDLTRRDTLYLAEPTNIDGRLSPDYDTLLCWITHLGEIVAQPLMSSDGKGRWYGKVTDLSGWRGDYRAEYYGIYDDGDPATADTFPRFEAFSVQDTAAYFGVDIGLTVQEIWEYNDMDDRIEALIMFFGACDSCYYYLYPIGTGNKDSLVIFEPDGTRKAKVVYKYGADPSIVDTAVFFMAPWW